ncbi:MAG: helix-turn-helix domain-containing protein [Actinomycetota bacterium]
MRAQVLRLSHRGSNIQTIASYTGRSRASVGRDLDRWVERGFEPELFIEEVEEEEPTPVYGLVAL